jgi:hypothetical protein
MYRTTMPAKPAIEPAQCTDLRTKGRGAGERATPVQVAVITFVVIAGIAAFVARERRRRHMLRDRFGPEYARRIEAARSRREAERQLAGRAERRDKLDNHPLTEAARQRYAAQWAELQGRFVDRPVVAVVDADELVAQVMRDRGYPVDDFDSQSELISVDHPDVVQNYRTGHTIFRKTTTGEASTEELRQAVVSYRALFEELLAENGTSPEDESAPAEHDVRS